MSARHSVESRKRADRLSVQSHVVSRARFAPLSFGGKCRYTIAESLASSSHSSFPESSDRGPGFGYQHVYAERGRGVTDDFAHDESDVCRADSNGECAVVFRSGFASRFHRRHF